MCENYIILNIYIYFKDLKDIYFKELNKIENLVCHFE